MPTGNPSAFLADFNPGHDLIFPSVTKLSLHMHNIRHYSETMHTAILAKFVPLFPAITCLETYCPPRQGLKFLFRTRVTPFLKLTSLSVQDPCRHFDDLCLMTPQPFLPPLRRLEFNVSSQVPTFGTRLLHIFAPFLEHVNIQIASGRHVDPSKPFCAYQSCLDYRFSRLAGRYNRLMASWG